MYHRIVEVDSPGTKLRTENGSLKIETTEGRVAHFRTEELDCVLLSHPGVSLSNGALAELMAANVQIVACDRRFQPTGVMLPFGATYLTNVFRCQLGVAEPLRKRLWQAVVQQKIVRQAAVLRDATGDDCGLCALAQRVRSGDAENVEAQVAVRFWKRFPGVDHGRDRLASDLNMPLNYVYIVLFASMARAICAAGLHPNLGLCHQNQYNPFCLASDLIEPYREVGERAVLAQAKAFSGELTRDIKRALLGEMLGAKFGEGNLSLSTAMQRTAVSLRESYAGGSVKIDFPELVRHVGDDDVRFAG